MLSSQSNVMLPKLKIRNLSSKYNALLNHLNLLLYLCSCIAITKVISIQFLKIIAKINDIVTSLIVILLALARPANWHFCHFWIGPLSVLYIGTSLFKGDVSVHAEHCRPSCKTCKVCSVWECCSTETVRLGYYETLLNRILEMT